MRSRAFRRHQASRHMWRRSREDRAIHSNRSVYRSLDWVTHPKRMARFKEQPQWCSRECCGNQRHVWGKKVPTMQERRFFCNSATDY